MVNGKLSLFKIGAAFSRLSEQPSSKVRDIEGLEDLIASSRERADKFAQKINTKKFMANNCFFIMLSNV